MKKLFKIRNRSSLSDLDKTQWPAVDIDAQIEAMRNAEADQNIDLGRRIHYFPYRQFELHLDRDITGMYRVIANVGNERRYSFSITCQYGDYEALRTAYEEIFNYLKSNRRIADLPNNERLKGHYFGS